MTTMGQFGGYGGYSQMYPQHYGGYNQGGYGQQHGGSYGQQYPQHYGGSSYNSGNSYYPSYNWQPNFQPYNAPNNSTRHNEAWQTNDGGNWDWTQGGNSWTGRQGDVYTGGASTSTTSDTSNRSWNWTMTDNSKQNHYGGAVAGVVGIAALAAALIIAKKK